MCEKCGGMVSDKAEKCPNCGEAVIPLVECPECKSCIPASSITCPECGCPQADSRVCPECEVYISKTDTVCPHCGCPIREYDGQQQSDSGGENRFDENRFDGEVDDRLEDVDKFNWGASILWPLWGCANGMPYTLLIAVAWAVVNYNMRINATPASYTDICLYQTVIGAIISLVFGINGGKWAYKRKNWRGMSHFKKVQNSWTNWGVSILYIFTLLVGIDLITMGIQYYGFN